MPPKEAFFSCDWGTSRFRLRLIRADTEEVLSEVVSDDGVAVVATRSGAGRTEEFQRLFLQATSDLASRHSDVSARHAVISGMASSSMGWREIPYATLPIAISPKSLICETMNLPGMTATLISGLSTQDDVLRGEETELLGLCSLLPELQERCAATLILPGTHSKHLKLSQGHLVGFETFMTGELFAHLQTLPTLKTCLDDQWDPNGFERGLNDAADIGLMRALFKIRARKQLGHPPEGRAYLSGVLIATELAGLQKKEPIWIAAGSTLSERYAQAAAFLGIKNVVSVRDDLMSRATVRAHRLVFSALFQG